MDLNKPATADQIDAVTYVGIREWAKNYLPDPSAEGFAEWLNDHIGDREDEDITIHDVLTGAYQEWIGNDLPSP